MLFLADISKPGRPSQTAMMVISESIKSLIREKAMRIGLGKTLLKYSVDRRYYPASRESVMRNG